ncbi:DNA translocase FtsK [Ciceribacter azotifigens]|uniref:DNA translocase FtsK n=1 Tax=Ciceribacter azotifigens TaxID=2069303 RepID=UPI003A859542
MRFSRSNFSRFTSDLEEERKGSEAGREKPHKPAVNPADPQTAASGDTAGNTDSIAASEIEGRDAPIWQRAFVLGPNVRFTRTPDTALSKRVPAAQTIQPVIATAPSQTSEPVASAPVTAVPPRTSAESAERVIARPQFLPQPPDAKGARALSYRLRRELARSPAEETLSATAASDSLQVEAAAAPNVTHNATVSFEAPEVGQTESPTTIAPVRATSGEAYPLSPTAFLSDHVFWEAMIELDDRAAQTRLLPQPAEPKIATVPVAAAVAETSARSVPVQVNAPAFTPPAADAEWSVTSLYRQVDLRRSDSTVAANQTVPEAIVVAEPTAPFEPVADEKTVPSAIEVAERPALRGRSADIHAPSDGGYEFPSIDLLQLPQYRETHTMTPEALEQSAGLLESVLEDFGVKGEIIDVRPGPVVTLYEFEPAPGVKSSRVIGLSDDIARSMSALSARVAVVPGRNVIGIELPNPVRETVYFRELIESRDYSETRFQLPVCLGKTIGGEPVIAELAKMPHLLVAGTTGSGKSVAINTMILSLLYRLKPEECRLIMVDPKMLELSVYDGIPHLLTPVVTDPKKAVMALKWAVREMEDRYRKMSRLGVRNIDGYNGRAATARTKGETILCTIQSGFDRSTGEAIYEQEEMDLSPMPYIVVIVDEMADLMMVAGKEIEGAIQRLAQMARAAGIHLIMATQRPSVDVITGTIKANFPTRISFQVTSKIDSRTILGEQGAEHLLGQGDMLHMMGGGRIARVHGPFVSDHEVEKVVAHLKTQGRPEYLGTVTEDADEAETDEDEAVFDRSAMGEEDATDLYDKAVKIVMRDKKCSTSYIQRKLSIGYNRAASLVERMEQEGLVGPANHVGKRSIIADGSERGDGAV